MINDDDIDFFGFCFFFLSHFIWLIIIAKRIFCCCSIWFTFTVYVNIDFILVAIIIIIIIRVVVVVDFDAFVFSFAHVLMVFSFPFVRSMVRFHFLSSVRTLTHRHMFHWAAAIQNSNNNSWVLQLMSTKQRSIIIIHSKSCEMYVCVILYIIVWFWCVCVCMHWSYGKCAKQNNNHMLIRCKFKTNIKQYSNNSSSSSTSSENQNGWMAKQNIHREIRVNVNAWIKFHWIRIDVIGGEWSAKCQGDTLNPRIQCGD